MRLRIVGFLVSLTVITLTTFSLATQGLKLGLDFTGGVQVEAAREVPFDSGEVRTQVANLGFEESNVTTADGGNTVIIRVPLPEDGSSIDSVARLVTGALGDGVTIRGASAIDGKVSNELRFAGILACVFALVAIALYIWFRFESKFAWSALLTTFHDVYAIVGLFSMSQWTPWPMTFDLTIVAAVLTVAGYSINDTIVVFDRIREMLKKYKKLPLPQIIDISVTATLSRTLITSVATLNATLAMMFLGGPVLFGFAAAITFGIVIGTVSSIFIAAPLLIHLPGRVPGSRTAGADQQVAEATS